MKRVILFGLFGVVGASINVPATIINIPDDYPTIQQGIDASTDGDTVLVQPGTYVENINFNGHNIVLGSLFLTTGDTTYIAETIIDGDSTGFVVTFQNHEHEGTITGFTIQNGSGHEGAGIYCHNSNPNISHNVITDNYSAYGGGIYCYLSNPAIANNSIMNNTGGGVYCEYSSPTIAENIISGNSHIVSGGGIYIDSSYPIIDNNTITGNSASLVGGGIWCVTSAPILSNNTISGNFAANGGGIHSYHSNPNIYNTILWANSDPQISTEGTGYPVVTYCDVQGGWEGQGNINSNPLFVDPYNDNYNVCSQSPCIDAGNPDIHDPDGSRSDIGVFYWEHPDCDMGNIWYVSTDGDDSTGDGSENNPFRTIQHGIDISNHGDTVLALVGSYEENIDFIGKDILITSNYIFTEDSLDIQNTIIDGESAYSVVTIEFCGGLATIMGFTIKNGYAQNGGGIFCNSSNPVIKNNIISGNIAEFGNGGGIHCLGSSPTIVNNEISQNEAYEGSPGSYGGGIYCQNSSPIISNNLIIDNSADGGGGISCTGYSNPMISQNIISANVAYGSGAAGGGIHCWDHPQPEISDNLISENMASSVWGGNGGGIAFTFSKPHLTDNTIKGNSATASGGGIYLAYWVTNIVNIERNLIIYNESAHYGGGICIGPTIRASITSNTICNNNAAITAGGIYVSGHAEAVTITNVISWYNSSPEIYGGLPTITYSNIRGGWDGEGNIDIIPQLADPVNDDYNVCSESPCIDAGDPNRQDPDGTRSDIGLFFWEHPECPPVGSNIYVSTSGNDSSGDGSPENPFRTIQHAIEVSFYHDTVIAVNGTYVENINFVGKKIILTSNFTFSGDTLDIQNTIIDGGLTSAVVTFESGEDSLAILRGFTISNGLGSGVYCIDSEPIMTRNIVRDNEGSGIICYNSEAVIDSSIIRGNFATSGGGIHCNAANPTITNNYILENSTDSTGGGIYCCNRSDAVISNNSISGNMANYSGGAISCDDSSPLITNNSIIMNSSVFYGGALFCWDWHSPTVSNNLISANTAGSGGGIWCRSNPTIIENTISENSADSAGGGIYCEYSSPSINGNTIDGNSALVGGGICSWLNSSPVVDGNEIIENHASNFGGGIYCRSSSPRIKHNIILENSANDGGGLTCSDSSSAWITSNTIKGNTALGLGGGLFITNSSSFIFNNLVLENLANYGGGFAFSENSNPSIANNLLSGNSATDGGGFHIVVSSPFIHNTIARDDSAANAGNEIFVDDLSLPTISYCNIEGGWEGNGNIDLDPFFRDPENGDYHLMSIECGDPYDSPCIDAGHPEVLDSLLDCSWGLGSLLSDISAYGGGIWGQVGIDEQEPQFPIRFKILQNYPNPFNSSTTIQYELPVNSNVTIEIYDVLGRRVATLVNEKQPAGYHQVIWNAKDKSSGMYFYRIQAGEFIETKKMLLLK